MRKTILPNAIDAARPGGELTNLARSNLNENLNDGREVQSPPAYRAGFAGRLMGPTRGFIWATKVGPDGSGIPIQVYVPTDQDNNITIPLELGQAIAVRRNVGSAPNQWLFGGISSDDEAPPLHEWVGSCSTVPDGYTCPPGSHWGTPNGFQDASGGNSGQRCFDDQGNMVAAVAVTDLQAYLQYLENKKQQRGTTDTGVKIVSGFPPVNTNGDVVSLRGENATYIYIGGTVGGWQVLTGPTSGVFTLSYTSTGLTAGTVVSFPPGINEVIPADNRDITLAGNMVGVVVYDRDPDTYALIQLAGDFPFVHGFTQNKPLYMSTAGSLTDTPPASGSGCIFQRIGYARNRSNGSNSSITIDVGEAIVRSGTITITTGDPDDVQENNIPNNTVGTIAAFKAVFFDSTGMRLADASAGSDYPCKGFTIASVASAANGTVFKFGHLNGFVGLTKGAVYYLDPANPGGITASIPTGSGEKVQAVGVAAYDGTTLLVNPDLVPIVL